jgi:hypothetical protein
MFIRLPQQHKGPNSYSRRPRRSAAIKAFDPNPKSYPRRSAAIKAFESSEEKKTYTSTSAGKAAGAAASRARFKALALAARVKGQGK